MSKRGADEYITKEHGTTANTNGESTSVKMATAAQMAKRKLATPKGRLGSSRGPSPSPFNGVGNPNPNPFGQPSPDNPEQQQQQQPNGGFSFGASQSFPTTNPESSGFNFQPPQAASFTFGSTPAANSNPFANVNGNANPNSIPAEDTMMESPQKKPAFGGAFGQPTNTTANGSTGFSFGQPSQQQSIPSFSFGAVTKPDDQNKPTNGLFGNMQKVEEPKQTSLFGQGGPVQPTFGGFGSSDQQTKPSQPSQAFSFGGFGQQSKTTEPVVNGVSSNGAAPPQTSSSGFSLAQSSTSTSAAPSQSMFAGFGAPKPEEPKSSSSLFGQPPPSQPSTTSNIFGSPSPANQPFSVSAEPKPSDAPVGNPFAGLFAASQSPSPQPTSPAEQQADAPKAPTFSFGASSSTPAPMFDSTITSSSTASNNVFGNVSKPAETVAAPKFSFGSMATPQSKPESSLTNGSAEAAQSNNAAPQKPTFSFGSSSLSSASAQPSKTQDLFGKLSTASMGGDVTKDSEQSSSKPRNLFGTPTSAHAMTTAAPQSQNLFGTSSSNERSSRQLQEPSKPALFGSSKPTERSNEATQSGRPAANTGSSFDLTTKASTSSADGVTSTTNSTSESASTSAGSSIAATSSKSLNPQRPVYTKSPARIPNYLNGEGYKEYDTNYRLRSLNREFQKRIATLDSEVHDFENIIRHYVAARDSIGASLGLYIRNVAGSKRKNDGGADENQDIPPQYKRARPAQTEDTTMDDTTSQTQPAAVAPAVPAAAQVLSQSAVTSQKPSGSSRATEVFKSMIPTSPSKSAGRPAASTNVFASIKPQPASTPSFGASKPAADTSKPETAVLSASNIFGKPSQSTTPVKSPPKKPAFEMPKPVAGGFGAFGSLAQKSAKEFEKTLKEKRKAEDFDSDEDDEAEFEKNFQEEQQKKKEKLEAIAKTGFAPTFGNTASTTPNAAFSFGAQPKPSATNTQSSSTGFSFGGFKPSGSTAPTSTSTFSGFKPTPSMGKSTKDPVNVSDDDDDEDQDSDADAEGEDSEHRLESNEEESEGQDEDDLAEDEVPSIEEPDEETDDNDLRAAMEKNPNKGKSLFDRVSAPSEKQPEKTPINGEKPAPEKPITAFSFGSPITQPAQNQAFKPSVWGSNIGKSTPEALEASPITPASTTKESYKPATGFSFTPTPHTSPPPTEGASIFSGGTFGATPSKFEGMFGSRPSTPSNIDKHNIFGQPATSTPTTDHTWKPGSAIKFGTPDKSKDAPSVSVTAPSPGRDESGKSFSGLFGNSNSNSKSAESAAQLGFSFGAPTGAPAPGFLGAAPHLGGGSGTTSGFSSRATSPGLTDNESVATNESEDVVNDPQTSLLESRAGEENEDCLWESRAKAIKFYPAGSVPKGTKYAENTWNTMGVGQLRVLKDKTTGKARVVLRADPGASIILNQRLVPDLEYEQQIQGANKGGAVKFPVMENDALWRWVLKVKTDEMGKQLSDILEGNKGK